jgi:PAS domain S-box-containing protein
MPIADVVLMRQRITELEAAEAGSKQADQELQSLRRDLAGRIKEGTAELARANERLQTEISDLRKVDEALRESEEKFRSFIEEMNDGYCVIQDSTIAFANARIAAMFGYTPEDVIGKSIQDFLPPEIIRQLAEMHARRKRGEDVPQQYETTLTSKDSTLPVEFGARTIPHEGRPAVSVVIRDISERKAAEARLAQTMQDLARSNAELEQFAYVASHDLQEPLRMVTSFVQLLARRYQGRLDPEADEYISFAVDGASRMQTLINDLLAYSRLGTRGYSFELTDCETAFRRAIENLSLAIEDSRAHLTHDPLPTVTADGAQLVLLLQNLIGNAIKFRGEEQPRIHVSALRQGNEWVFSVQDNGIGFDPEFSDRIFLIFQRLHARTEYGGTGIGLAIAKKIVERHGGRIWVESETGQGATFYFTIPELGGNET